MVSQYSDFRRGGALFHSEELPRVCNVVSHSSDLHCRFPNLSELREISIPEHSASMDSKRRIRNGTGHNDCGVYEQEKSMDKRASHTTEYSFMYIPAGIHIDDVCGEKIRLSSAFSHPDFFIGRFYTKFMA